jgi:hypothetical protein
LFVSDTIFLGNPKDFIKKAKSIFYAFFCEASKKQSKEKVLFFLTTFHAHFFLFLFAKKIKKNARKIQNRVFLSITNFFIKKTEGV